MAIRPIKQSTSSWFKMISPFLLIFLLLLASGMFSINLLTSIHSYVGNERRWAIAESIAIDRLRQYALHDNELDFQLFQKEVAVPLAVRTVRSEMAASLARGTKLTFSGAVPDAQAFEDDTRKMLTFFHSLRINHIIDSPAQSLLENNNNIVALVSEANNLHAKRSLTPGDVGFKNESFTKDTLSKIAAISNNLERDTTNFVHKIEISASQLEHLIYSGLALFTLVLLSLSGMLIKVILRKKYELEQSLKTSGERLQLAILGSSDGVWDWDIVDKTVYYSERLCVLLEESVDTSIFPSANFLQFVHPLDLVRTSEHMQEHLKNDTPYDIEFRILPRSGGEIWVRSRARCTRDKNGQPIRMAGSVMDISDKKKAEQEITRLAFYDSLTGLPNRALLLSRLERALSLTTRNNNYGAVLFIDLDNFKTLNDTMGHDRGDMLLQQVAHRLTGCVRECDTVARLGGDEFVLILEDVSHTETQALINTRVVVNKILSVFSTPFVLSGAEFYSSPSIGVTLFSDTARDIDEILKRADIAMYEAKAAGRNAARFYDPSMQEIVNIRAAIESDLRISLGHTEHFALYYQPQVNVNGAVTGMEALVRWNHPIRGLVSPADFIPVCEDSGLIIALGDWVMESACKQLRQWESVPGREHLTIAVNVSARQFRHADFFESVLSVLDSTKANPNRLKIELTESMLLDNIENTIAKMTLLKTRGVRFSLDDFGTGYSSLSYLKKLPLDQLKIDQSFVEDILGNQSDAEIAKAIIALGQNLGLSVIAEGVENIEQKHALVQLGCHLFQGNVFHPAAPITAIENYLDLAMTTVEKQSGSTYAPILTGIRTDSVVDEV